MNKFLILLILLVLVGGGYYGYQHSSMAPKSEAFQANQKFADHMARDQYQEAKSLTAGAALQQVRSPPPADA